ncbi:MAG: hypothetical protein KGI54_18555 [Pseudomonadota bacterium]|nr:hypothetical protein [Pseudomonadota bacterium]
MRTSKELQTGKAGEYLVCADLILKGFVAFPSEQGLPYDVLLDTGERLLKVQVKTTSGARKVPQRNKDTLAYIFNVKRNGKNGKGRYHDGEVDLFALVCLDVMKVGYLVTTDMPDTLNIRLDSMRGSYYDEDGIATHAKVLELKETHTQTQIAGKLGKQIAVINRMCKTGYEPHKTNARYFSDFARDAEWFLKL